jgi:protocatechuate 3,4-dioxygenase beta subunit
MIGSPVAQPFIGSAGEVAKPLPKTQDPAGPNLIRPAHIHFQVSGRQDRLVTQMYFENDPHNEKDPFLNSAGRKQLLITKLLDPSPEFEPDSKVVVFDMVVYNG